MRSGSLFLLAGALAFAACSSERYPTEESEAKKAVDEAKVSGADKHSAETLRTARKMIDEARASEAQATRDEREARGQLDGVDQRDRASRRRLAEKQDALRTESAAHDDFEARRAQLEQRRADLRYSGATEEELHHNVDPELALAQARARSSDAMMSTLSEQVQLGELERSEIDLQRQAAQARLDNARQRGKLARTLYERAQEQAKLAESESLAAQRVEIRDRGTP